MDAQVYDLAHFQMSGHALKHFVSGIGTFFLVRYIMVRKPA